MNIPKRTPAEWREFFAQSPALERDSDSPRNWQVRWFFLGVSAFVFVGTLLTIGIAIGGWFGAAAAMVIITEVYAYLLPRRFFIFVPQLQGLVTQDIFLGRNVVYGPGLHVAFPWENRSAESNVPLFLIDIGPITATITTITSQVIIRVGAQIRPSIESLERFFGALGVDKGKIIEEAGKTFVGNELLSLQNLSAREILALGKDKVAPTLQESFYNQEKTPFRTLQGFGVGMAVLEVNDISLPAELQKAKDAEEEAAAAFRGVAAQLGITVEELKQGRESGDIPHQFFREMLDRFISQGNPNATHNVNSISLPEEAIKAAMAMFSGGRS